MEKKSVGCENNSNNISIGIGDVARICEVPVYTIRYWEKEFKEELLPLRTKGNQRRYSDKDINKICQIKKLLWKDGFSIKGAKRVLKGNTIFPESACILDHGLENVAQNINPDVTKIIKKQLPQFETAA